jgi:hypothetical protein
MDEVSSRSEHCFASQRARFEGSKVVVEHIRDVVDELLGQTHTTVMDRSGNCLLVQGSIPHKPSLGLSLCYHRLNWQARGVDARPAVQKGSVPYPFR